MAYGKRQLDPPAFPAVAAPVPAHVQSTRRRERERPTLVDRFRVARGWWRALGLAFVGAAALAELGSDPATAWFALPMLTILTAAGGYGAYQAAVGTRRLSRSATAPGVVSGVDVASRRRFAVVGERPTVRFISADGEEHECAAHYPHRALRVGRSVRARYDPRDPSWVVIEDEGFRDSLTVWRAVGLLLVPAMLGLAVGVAGLLGA